MNILFVGDLHCQLNNFDDLDLLLIEIRKYISNNTIDMIILLGDILHSFEKVLSPCLNKACFFIKECSLLATTYVLVGNHDYINNSQLFSEQHWLNPLKQWENVVIVDNIVKNIKANILLCPYVPLGKLVESLEKEPYWKEYKVIFCHQEIKGAKMGAFISEEGDEWKENYPLLISGHIHEEQKPQKNVYYVGSPLQHGYSNSSDDKIFGAVYIEEGSLDPYITRIPITTIPKKILYKADINQLNQKKTEFYDKNTKIILNDSNQNFKIFKQTEEYKNLIKKGVQFKLQKECKKINKERKVGNFRDILKGLIIETKDDSLMKEFNLLFQ